MVGLFSCSNEQDCKTYDCRRENISIILEPKKIKLGETAKLSVKREHLNLPHFRVFMGEYDENFQLIEGDNTPYFKDTDSLASINLKPESKGVKVIEGIIEEYEFISSDSIFSYRYPYRVELTVR